MRLPASLNDSDSNEGRLNQNKEAEAAALQAGLGFIMIASWQSAFISYYASFLKKVASLYIIIRR